MLFKPEHKIHALNRRARSALAQIVVSGGEHAYVVVPEDVYLHLLRACHAVGVQKSVEVGRRAVEAHNVYKRLVFVCAHNVFPYLP